MSSHARVSYTCSALFHPSLAIVQAVCLMSAIALGACTAAPSATAPRLTLVAYSTPREAYEQIIAAFQKTPAGQNVAFDQSYGGSGEQSRAVAAGLPADIVALSVEPDVTD
jgi:sulfate/thiosulfate transport system substrate-binding protein